GGCFSLPQAEDRRGSKLQMGVFSLANDLARNRLLGTEGVSRSHQERAKISESFPSFSSQNSRFSNSFACFVILSQLSDVRTQARAVETLVFAAVTLVSKPATVVF